MKYNAIQDKKQLLQCLCLIIITVTVMAILITDRSVADQIAYDTAEIKIKGNSYLLEIAETARQRQTGLMHRTQLPVNSAMLFVYPLAGNHRIWMKNTLIPLTVVWFDDNETVVHKQRLEPCRIDPCPSYGSEKASRYIIEFSSQFSDLAIGDRLPIIRKIAGH